MGPDQPGNAFARTKLRIERCNHACVVLLQDFQEQRAGKFFLRSEEMEEAAVGRSREIAYRGHRRALEAVALEHGEACGQEIVAGGGGHLAFSPNEQWIVTLE